MKVSVSGVTGRFVFVLVLALAAGCGGGIATSQTGDPPPDPGPGQDPAPDPTPEPADPAQLAITRFEVSMAAASSDPYEPNDTDAFYLGGYGYEYVVDDAALSPVSLSYTVEVTNTGAPVTAPFNVELFRDAETPPSGQLGDLRQELPSLDAGASAELVFPMTDAEPGARLSWSAVDVSNQVPESDETDNLSEGLPAEVAADVDVFSVFQTADYPIYVDLEALPADYDVELLAPDGTVLARSQNDGTASESFSYPVTANGTYRVRVYGYAGARAMAPYRLRVTVP